MNEKPKDESPYLLRISTGGSFGCAAIILAIAVAMVMVWNATTIGAAVARWIVGAP